MNSEMSAKSIRLAVLIDGENASADSIEALLKEVTKFGTAHVKRIYGDWTNGQLIHWKAKLNKLAIQPIQQFRYTTGKNSTDSALIIDAMDLLYTRNFDGFCIVSSDSDFTRLASRIRESGLVVYGFGEQKTPEAFASACDKFIYTEELKSSENCTEKQQKEPKSSISELVGIDKQAVKELQKTPKSSAPDPANASKQSLKIDKKLLKLLKDAYEAIVGNDGWASLAPLGAQIRKLCPDFNYKSYGYKQLRKLLQATKVFDLKETSNNKNPKLKDVYIRHRTVAST
ncbi:MAG: NYN domain-containing protein [Phormidesmis sp. CAN_BIN36]|nr:NYN domain-containing protein [Phormidesmis sp. CAN_BIN36]